MPIYILSEERANCYHYQWLLDVFALRWEASYRAYGPEADTTIKLLDRRLRDHHIRGCSRCDGDGQCLG